MTEPELELEVERWVYGAHGLARGPEGEVLLVEGGLPGERVRARRRGRRAGVSWASLVEILRASPARVEPDCPLHGRCGGCQLRHVRLAAQADLKCGAVREALERQGCAPPPDLALAAVSAPDGWRHRLRYRGLDGTERAGRPGPLFGFATRGGRGAVAVEFCRQAHPAAEALRPKVEAVLRPFGAALHCDELLLEVPSGPAPRLCLELRAQGPARLLRRAAEALREGLPELAGLRVFRGRQPLYTQGDLELDISLGEQGAAGELSLRVPSGGFFQANVPGAPALVRTVLELLAPTPGLRVLELFAGAGTLTLPLLAAGCHVWALEGAPEAVKACRRNLARHGWSAQVEQRDLRRGLGSTAALPAQALVLDPARGGARELMPELAALPLERMVYVSCDPPSLGRDLKALREAGWEPRVWRMLDLFPQTFHAELVLLLERA